MRGEDACYPHSADPEQEGKDCEACQSSHGVVPSTFVQCIEGKKYEKGKKGEKQPGSEGGILAAVAMTSPVKG